MTPKKAALNFEKSLDELEALVDALEGGDLSLENALKRFEEGIKLTRSCQTALNDAEQKVQVLLEENGVLKTLDFEQPVEE